MADEIGVHGVENFVFNGTVWEGVRTPSIFKPFVNKLDGDTIWTPAAGKRIRLMGFVVGQSVSGSGLGLVIDPITPVNLFFPSLANQSVVISLYNGLLLALNTGLKIKTDGTATGFVFGCEE